MSTLATPSAKSHERVTGRWEKNIEIGNRREWFVYYTKIVVGSPIPWLVLAFAISTFCSRAALEISAWSIAALTLIYLISDRFSRSHEFKIFRIGADFFLLGLVLTGLASAINSDVINTLGDLRWIALLVLLTYMWELFPGLNRVFTLLFASSVALAIYAIVQHFTGMDYVSGEALTAAPVKDFPYFLPTGFFGSPAILGTLLALMIPFPAAAYFLGDDRNQGRILRYGALAAVLLLSLGVFWTYQSGLWITAIGGLFITMIMRGRQIMRFIAIFAAFFTLVVFVTYGTNPSAFFASLGDSEQAHANHQRAQINNQVKVWENSPWVGVGHEAMATEGYDPGTGNIYFQILAQTGVLGGGFYLMFVMSFLLATYRLFGEIPTTHFWHRVLVSGSVGAQLVFHLAGLYWSTLSESAATYLFVLILSAMAYLIEHYGRGLVPDDSCL